MVVDHTLFVAPFNKIPSLGRFVLRDAGATIAIGTILELKKPSKNCSVCYKHVISNTSSSVHVVATFISTSELLSSNNRSISSNSC